MDNDHPLLPTSRSPWPFAIMIVTAAALLGSWLWPTTRGSWDATDIMVFRLLNETLTLGSGWQKMWAFLNSRIFDFISGGLLLALLLTSYWEQRSGKLAIISFGLLSLGLIIGRQIGTEAIVTQFWEYQRPSPTLTLDNCHRLSELVPTIDCKDASPWSFPGDHGFVVLSIAIYMSFWSRRRTVIAAWCLALILILPRIVAGGHWLTDILIGSLSMALVTMSLLVASGLHDALASRICKLFDGLIERASNSA